MVCRYFTSLSCHRALVRGTIAIDISLGAEPVVKLRSGLKTALLRSAVSRLGYPALTLGGIDPNLI
jgi:hypothetical protein